MGRYRKIDPRIWNDAKFRVLSEDAKLVFFMLLTHPNMTSLGAMRATRPGLAAELRWQADRFCAAFAEVLAQGLCEHDEGACFVGLPNFLRYNQPESPNVVKAWADAVDLLPECHLKDALVRRARCFAAAKSEPFAEAFRQAFGEAMPYPEQEQEQEQEPKPDKAARASPVGEEAATVIAIDHGPPCPHADIVALYHELLPELARVRDWTADRQRLLRKRWRERAEHQSLTWWRDFFEFVRGCDFLMGRVPARDGHAPFECDLEWLLRPKNFLKVIEGKYQPREGRA